MCLMLYIGTADEIPTTLTPELRVETVEDHRRPVTQWFSLPAVRFLGAHTGCSCGFPSVMAETPVAHYEGMPLESDDRAADLRSVRALLDLIRDVGAHSGQVELYPVSDGDESLPPNGQIEWWLEDLVPETFFFNERFLHVVHTRHRD